jgi:hypothetical protein
MHVNTYGGMASCWGGGSIALGSMDGQKKRVTILKEDWSCVGVCACNSQPYI